MTLEIGLVFLVLTTIIVLFVLEVFPMDKIAFCTIGVLILLGLVTPEEAISGFSNSAVITILCLMIIATALEQNGVISWLANGLKKFHGWPTYFMVPAFMFIAGSISAFISSTAVVIVFIKIVTELSDKYPISKSRLLLPISFASILGGSCTLMGTSTNLIVNSIFQRDVGERLMFFEFSWLGLIFLGTAIVLITVLSRFLPKDSTKNLSEQYDVDKYVAAISLAQDSKLIGKSIKDTFLSNDNIYILKLLRKGLESQNLDGETILKEDDSLLLSCDLEQLMQIKSNSEVLISSDDDGPAKLSNREFSDAEVTNDSDQNTQVGNVILVELLMLPGARFLGKSLNELRKVMPHDAIPIAIKKRKNLRYLTDRLFTDNLNLTRLKVGDRVLVEIEKEKIRDFDFDDNIAILQQYEAPEISRAPKRNLSLFILLVVIAFAATGTISILASTLVGCMALLLTNCIDLETTYKRVNWQILILLAGMIPLGIAMNNTGTDKWLTEILIDLMHGQAPLYALGILFLVTLVLSSVISNNATAIIMAPLAISIAMGMELPVKPFVLAIMFAANFSFFTPVGYQTNALIYSMGIYRFKDFLVIGGILSLVLWILATLLLNTLI